MAGYGFGGGGQMPTANSRFAQLLAQSDPNNGTLAGGLGSMAQKLMMGLMLGQDQRDETQANEAFTQGMSAKPWVNPDSPNQTIEKQMPDGMQGPPQMVPMAQKAGGLDGGLAAMQGLQGNPYAGRMAQQLMVKKAETDQSTQAAIQKAMLEDQLLRGRTHDEWANKPRILSPGQTEFTGGQPGVSLPAAPKPPRTVTTQEGVFLLNDDGSLGNRLGAPHSQPVPPNQGLPPGYTSPAPGVQTFIPGGPADPKVIATQADARRDASLKPIPANINTAISENLQGIRKIDQTLDALDPEKGGDPTATGFIKNWSPQWALNKWDSEGTTARALIADIGSLKIHDRSGAAVSASESPRLMPFIPSIGDDLPTIKKKLANFRNEYQNMLNDMGQVYGADNGYKPHPLLGKAVESGAVAPGAGATGQWSIQRVDN